MERNMKQRKASKKRNPQDITLRNINALKKRVKELEAQFKHLHNRFEFYLEGRLERLEEDVKR
jgi:hypothetical protein